MDKARIYSMAFANVYLLYIQKAENKGRTKTAKTGIEMFGETVQAETTPADYLHYLDQREYNYIMSGENHPDYREAIT